MTSCPNFNPKGETMQLAHDATDELFAPYIGGVIVHASASAGVANRLHRGTLSGVRIIDGGWLDVELTCDEYTTGDLVDIDDENLSWTPSSGGKTHVLLHADITIDDDGTLHLFKETPQGGTATVKPALVVSTAYAA